jgi:hypothetical protein
MTKDSCSNVMATRQVGMMIRMPHSRKWSISRQFSTSSRACTRQGGALDHANPSPRPDQRWFTGPTEALTVKAARGQWSAVPRDSGATVPPNQRPSHPSRTKTTIATYLFRLDPMRGAQGRARTLRILRDGPIAGANSVQFPVWGAE